MVACGQGRMGKWQIGRRRSNIILVIVLSVSSPSILGSYVCRLFVPRLDGKTVVQCISCS